MTERLSTQNSKLKIISGFQSWESFSAPRNENGYNQRWRKINLPSDKEDLPFLNDAEPLVSEPRGFAPEQMLKCGACLRPNPPTRTSCLYCAAQLKATEASADLQRPTLRKLETWEQGVNVILLPRDGEELAEDVLREAAILLHLHQDDLRNIFAANVPLPVARAANDEEAALVRRRLAELNLSALVIGDRDLLPGGAGPRRARAFELTEGELLAHSGGGGETWRVAWDEIVLLVAGRLLTRRVEVEERRRRKTENEILDARETMADETVLDIHTAREEESLRVSSKSFDFSCLGARKSLVAAENFAKLGEVLRGRARFAAYDDTYNRLRRALATVWPLEERTEARGWNRSRPGRVSTEAATTSDNESQFTRYSRLRRYLKLHHGEI